MSTEDEIKPTVEPASPAVKPDERVYTAEQVEKKLQGQGKALAAAQAELEKIKTDQAEAAKAKLEAEGKITEALGLTKKEAANYKAEAATYKEQLEALQAERAARLDAIAKDNKRRLKALPEELRDFPLADDAEQAAAQLTVIESKIVGTPGSSSRVRTSPQIVGVNGKKQTIESNQNRINDLMMGRVPADGGK